MKAWVKRHPILTALLSPVVLGLAFLLIWGGMNASGFCWAEKRWLSDYEIVKIAFLYTQQGPQEALLTNAQAREYSREHYIPYKNLSEFHRLNPGCCEIRSANCPLSYKLFGQCRAGVNLHYQVRYRGADGTVQSFPTHAAPGMTNCGRSFTHYFD